MSRCNQRGLTLIELMVSMVLGLVVIGGVIGVMLANKRSFSTNQGLAQVQETARSAFELIARDIRQSGGNGCDNNNRTANVLTPGTIWWQEWYGVRGVNNGEVDPAVAVGGAVGQRVAGTDSIHVQGIEGVGFPVQDHDEGATTITVNGDAPFATGDIMMICDFDHATIFQASNYDAGTDTITHAAGVGTPGNCNSGLGFPSAAACGGTGNVYPFPENSQVGRLLAASWFVGNNDRPDEGGRSLYRRRLTSGGVEVTEEVVAGVTDLQVRYGENNSDDVVDASLVADWANVNSIFITLTADSADQNVTTNKDVNSGRIQRQFTYLITLRNRVP
jgi:type IV pilus assembly protein PilW